VRYVSTRGEAPAVAFDDVLLAGLAPDGGLYVPETWPSFSPDEIDALAGLDYGALAVRVMQPFVGEALAAPDLGAIVAESCRAFDEDIAPLKKIGDNEWLLELFHGPTLAFKDYALQFLGRMLDHVLRKRGQRATVIGATSGDTGSAAIEACRDRESIEIFILHPRGRVSEVQRRQMTTVTSANVHNVAIEGTFDDCQDLVKAMFADPAFRDRYHLSAVNSINWARIAAQIVYYFWAGAKLGAPNHAVSFSVPTGNFGNVFAAYAAVRVGLPVAQLVVASNRNDILTRFFASGRMTIGEVSATLSPSMDIQVSSNFERLLFEVFDRDGKKVAAAMKRFREKGEFAVSSGELEKARALFDAACFDDEATKRMIKQLWQETGDLVDPHTAVGIAAERAKRRDKAVPMVALATAHPAKFADAVEQATGVRPPLPERLKGLFEREERYEVLANDLRAVQDFVARRLAQRTAA